jgi:hypothetical protein
MNTYSNNDYEYFYDVRQKLWILYAINEVRERIEWDENDNPIEAKYFNNRKELNNFLKPK